MFDTDYAKDLQSQYDEMLNRDAAVKQLVEASAGASQNSTKIINMVEDLHKKGISTMNLRLN